MNEERLRKNLHAARMLNHDLMEANYELRKKIRANEPVWFDDNRAMRTVSLCFRMTQREIEESKESAEEYMRRVFERCLLDFLQSVKTRDGEG